MYRYMTIHTCSGTWKSRGRLLDYRCLRQQGVDGLFVRSPIQGLCLPCSLSQQFLEETTTKMLVVRFLVASETLEVWIYYFLLTRWKGLRLREYGLLLFR